MEPYPGIERRDPAASVLRLGRALATAHEEGRTGRLVVSENARSGEFIFECGVVTHLEMGGLAVPPSRWTGASRPGALEQIFGFERSRIFWRDDGPREGEPEAYLDPRWAVIAGGLARADVFEPQHLVERIPVDVLRLTEIALAHLTSLSLTSDVRDFLACLVKPTPVTMLLWKRGMAPRRAGALLVALNLLGAFRGSWEPGYLPRMSSALRVMGMVKRGCPDHLLLGVGRGARQPEVDRAFRRLSRELHPDRAEILPRDEAELARRAFLAMNDAYVRLRQLASRRRRPVTSSTREDGAATRGDDWRVLVRRARQAQEAGQREKARAYALKALVRMPPGQWRSDLVRFLSRAA